MALVDIQSPLPPRRTPVLNEEAATEQDNPVTSENANIPKTEEVKQPEAATTMASMRAPQKGGNPKKFLIFAGIAALILAIFFLVTKVILPALSGGGEQITLNYWGLWEEPATIQGVIADYEAKNPGIKINYVRNQKVNYRTRLKTRLEMGGEENVDIFRVHNSWVPMFKENLAKVPPETAKNIGLDGDYFEAFKADLNNRGSMVGIPLMYDGLSLFYNKDLVESGQVNLPKSWWDLEMAANKLTVRDSNGNITVSGAALGIVDNVDHWSDILGLMLKQGGVDPLASDAENEKKTPGRTDLLYPI